MSLPALIEAADLAQLLRQNPDNLLVADCRYSLTDAEAGAQAYAQGHIPGAQYVDPGKVLSGPVTGSNGRHPLPDPDTFAKAMAALGADNDTHIVIYDAADSSFAARLWWMLRWIGHEKVQVLNGGLRAWTQSGGALSTTPAAQRSGSLSVRRIAMPAVGFAEVRANLDSREYLVVDARGAERYRGENETIDPVGGHIPGALNRPFGQNLDTDGRFKTAAQLREEYQSLLGDTSPERVVHQCGSGISACHNLLALYVAGMQGGALYAGSWSEWCHQPDAPIARGPEA